jgi:DNA-binding GntR family transcriptional regulator
LSNYEGSDLTTPTEARVRQTVVDALRDHILDGRLAPGQRLIEADLMDQFGASRGGLREAFIQLDAEGLVELRHQRGASVMRLDRKSMADLFAVRERLEGLAAYLAAQNAGAPENRRWLRDQRKSWSRAILLHSEHLHMEENEPLHAGVVRMSGNERLARALRPLQVPAYRQQFIRIFNEERREESVEEHLMLIDALLAGDAAKAEKVMRLHVKRTGELAQLIDGLD